MVIKLHIVLCSGTPLGQSVDTLVDTLNKTTENNRHCSFKSSAHKYLVNQQMNCEEKLLLVLIEMELVGLMAVYARQALDLTE